MEYKSQDIIDFFDSIAPPDKKDEWDHVGLMVGGRKADVTGVVLALDCTHQAIALCEKTGANFLFTHHPLFFPSISSIEKEEEKGSLVYSLIQKNITVYAAHTNLDRVDNGVNDALARKLRLFDFHPFKENEIGVVGYFREEKSLFSLIKDMKAALGASGFFINRDTDRDVEKVFVSGGAFEGDNIEELREAGIHLVISGEIHHHHMLSLHSYGIAALSLGHDVTERVILPELENSIKEALPGLSVAVDRGLSYENIVI